MQKAKWGWNDRLEQEYQQYKNAGLVPGRVVRENRHIYFLAAAAGAGVGAGAAAGETAAAEVAAAGETGPEDPGLVRAEVSGAFQYRAAGPEDFPVVGDWVLYRPAGPADEGLEAGIIEGILPRGTKFSRKTAGEKTGEQIMAANVDKVYIVFGLDGGRNFSAGALERYLTLAAESGLSGAVVLNKADLCSQEERLEIRRQAEKMAPGWEILFVSARTGEGLDELEATWRGGMTIIVIGPSGVGKSSILNRLTGDELQRTQELRSGDLRGKHTTSHREMFFLRSGAMYIDSPGIKEIQLWGGLEALDEAFEDVASLAAGCRFRDCSHREEPGCAVRAALDSGELDSRRYENYLSLARELRYLEIRQDDRLARQEKEKWKKIHLEMRNRNKPRY